MSTFDAHMDYDYEEENPATTTLLIPWIMLWVGMAGAIMTVDLWPFSDLYIRYFLVSDITTPIMLLVCMWCMTTEYLGEKLKAGPWYTYIIFGFLFYILTPCILALAFIGLCISFLVGMIVSKMYIPSHE